MQEHNTEAPILARLTKGEFKALISILEKYGMRGLLSIAWELAELNHVSENGSLSEKARAERVSRELGALIERMDGFEELEHGDSLYTQRCENVERGFTKGGE